MFDVIVSDIEMPGLSGFDFTEVLRKNDAFKNKALLLPCRPMQRAKP
jgi:CheY-like chemotaxis protein